MTIAVTDDAVSLTVDDGVARVRMNRAAARNAWDDTLGDGLARAFAEVASRADVRVVVLEGDGSVFCAGADLVAGFPTLASGRDDLRSVLRTRFHPAFLALLDVSQPVIASVQGPAIGAGACLALAADIAVMADSTYLQFRFSRIGLMPDVGATALLATAVGPAKATELLMLADPIDAAHCAQLGLVSRVVAPADLEKECHELAVRLREGPTRAYATTKRAVRAWSWRGMAEQLEVEAELQQSLTGSDDWREGRAAFRERREPRFTGR